MSRSIAALLVALMLQAHPVYAGGGHHHDDHPEGAAHEEPQRGPHGGRLLEDHKFALEVTIFEAGVPPQFRLFPYEDGKALPPDTVHASVTLKRFGNKTETLELSPTSDYLHSTKTVEEPHSFEVEVTAEHNGHKHSWHYDSFEGRTVLSPEALTIAKLEIETAGPQRISNTARVYGRILADEDRIAHLSARFPGVVKEIRKAIGDRVEKAEVLAVVESNQNLQPYEIRSQVAGVIIHRHATLGEVVSPEKPLFIVADLSQLRADFQVYRDDIGSVLVGQKVQIELGENKKPVDARIPYVSPLTDEATQSKVIRAVLPNQSGELRPGLFVSGVLTASETPVGIAVKREAIQTFRDWDVVFLTDGHVFQATPVELGKRDAHYVEVLSGKAPGDRYVAQHSFIVKADIEKSGASHDH